MCCHREVVGIELGAGDDLLALQLRVDHQPTRLLACASKETLRLGATLERLSSAVSSACIEATYSALARFSSERSEDSRSTSNPVGDEALTQTYVKVSYLLSTRYPATLLVAHVAMLRVGARPILTEHPRSLRVMAKRVREHVHVRGVL